ncbi:hypothetical protein WA026_017634 [Henosepilachna vigintioctopunctata]|uniref:C3H1-type domain-containing protein n=1 Tax=Henosepilachna vigintioctopunctata TaxID=420089 RepID=A0AAW1V3C0_9CUCU
MEMKVLKISDYYSSYNLSSILFSQLSNYEMEFKVAEDEAVQFPVDQSEDIETSSIMKFADFSNMKLIILLNTLQFNIKYFEVEYSVGAVETFKDYLKTLHHLNKFIVMMQNEFSTNKNPEFEEFFLPVSRMCQSHLLALILCQSAEFLKSSSGQNDENEETTYAEFVQLVEIFAKSEEILEKLQYRSDDIFTELAKQACIVMPLTSIYSSNEDIIEYVTSISESEEEIVKKPPQICPHYLKIPCAFGPPRCTEFHYLSTNMEQLTKLLDLQIIIYKSNCDINKFYRESDDLREFVQTLKAFEEFKERKLKSVTFVHSFLNTIDNTLSHHISRILVSQFYSFIFHILLDHYSKLSKIENKTDAKNYRHIILDLFTLLCPVYQIPEKLCFRNDEFFTRYTYSLFDVRGLVISYTSNQLCKNISRVLRESRPYLEKFHKGYISRPMGLRKQINILEKKFCINDSIFCIDIQENGKKKSVHFKELANEVLQAKLS